MAERFIISIDFESPGSNDNGLIDFDILTRLDRILITVKPGNYDKARSFLNKNFNRCSIAVDSTAIDSPDDVVSLLDNGAAHIFVTGPMFQKIISLKRLADYSRLVLSLAGEASDGTIEEMATHIRSFWETCSPESERRGVHLNSSSQSNLFQVLTAGATQGNDGSCPYDCYISLDSSTLSNYEKAVQDGKIAIIPIECLTLDKKRQPHCLSIERLLVAALSSDRKDGLFSTIVTNTQGVCLGLVYSNEESIKASLVSGRGVYKSRKRTELWYKGATSGDIQELIHIHLDCDGDALVFVVRQLGRGFCHLKTDTCFGPYTGLSRLERTLKARITSAPEGSYTQRLFNDRNLLKAKIMEEAGELCEASTQEHIAAEAADLIYFALTKCIASGVDLQAIESNLNLKSLKTTRRRGDAKPQWSKQFSSDTSPQFPKHVEGDASSRNASEKVVIESLPDAEQRIQMTRLIASQTDHRIIQNALRRPAQRDSDKVVKITTAIINEVRQNGDAAVLRYTHQFEKATSLKSPILHAPFASELMTLSPETKEAIDISFENIKRFHAAQKDQEPLLVETMPGVVCSRFSRAITGVGLYIPGGTAILPSTALMLGVPAMVAGCERIVFASPPKADGTVTPEIVYIAHRVGADCIVLAGGAQAIAAMAYGTETIPKVDKILGPGNQFVTSAKMIVSNDTNAGVSIDMPAGPSEVLVIADKTAKPAFVASDLLSQAEHGKDSQVVLLTVGLDNNELEAIEQELHKQACALPRVEIVREAIEHSITIAVDSIEEALKLSNTYAPEHLILQVNDAESILPMIQNAGSVFVGMWTPESVGDYSAGVNHSLPTYGYAKQYSGVNLGSFTKHITSSKLTREGLERLGPTVMRLAEVEGLDAHGRAVSVRLNHLEGGTKDML